MLFCIHSLAALAATFSATQAFYCYLLMMQSQRQSEFCANSTYHASDPGQAGYPTLKRLHSKIWRPAKRVARSGRPGYPPWRVTTYYVNMRDYIVRWVTPPKRVTSPIWGPLPPCKQALKLKRGL